MPETNPRKPARNKPAGPPQPPEKTRRWKRTAATALLLLSGGAIVNVAVAWGSIRFAHKLNQPKHESVIITQPLSPRDAAWLEYAD